MGVNKELSLVFATKNRLPWLQKTMASIYEDLSSRQDYEIIVVDGKSTDGTVEYLRKCPNVKVIIEENPRGCCHAYDTALRHSNGEWVCWLNDDIEIICGAFENMRAFVQAPENRNLGMGAFLASHLNGFLDTYVVHNCFGLPLIYADFGFLRRSILEKVDYLDLSYHKYFWDSDLALKIWTSGQTVLPCPGAYIRHYFLEDDVRNSGEEQRDADYRYFRHKWFDKAFRLAESVYSDERSFSLIVRHLEQSCIKMIMENQASGGVHAV